ncbi:MAG: hypothetical protein LBC75_02515 [Fibromonadaceae bacterium]|nr:hypothetical protein [Fibromonadaceae bacterium]
MSDFFCDNCGSSDKPVRDFREQHNDNELLCYDCAKERGYKWNEGDRV